MERRRAEIDKGAPKTLVLSGTWADDGDALARSKEFIPFFKFRGPRKWEYIGDYRVRESTEDPQIVRDEAKSGKHDQGFAYRLVLYLESREEAASPDTPKRAAIKSAAGTGRAFQPDQAKKVAVENAAINKTAQHFKGWRVEDVSDKNKGWDLEATKEDTTLYLEVKGLSGSQIVVEVTPNEFERMQQHEAEYRVCIVTNALSPAAAIHVYKYRLKIGDMINELNGKRLAVKKITAARLIAV